MVIGNESYSMEIESVDSSGLMSIKFSEPMVDEDEGFDLSSVNPETLQIDLQSVDDIEMTWEPVSFTNGKLVIQLIIAEPLKVSSNIEAS